MSFFKIKPSRYKLAARLNSHTDTINYVAISVNGNYLASDGSNGVRLWDIDSNRQLNCPQRNISARGPATCGVWTMRQEDRRESLCYRSVSDILHFGSKPPENELKGFKNHFEESCVKRIGTAAGEITCLACNTSDDAEVRIVLGTRAKVVQVWKLDPKGMLHSVFSVELSVTVPKSVDFANNTAKDVYLFGLYNGQMQTMWGDDGKVVSVYDLGSRIGGAKVSCQCNQFVIDNTVDGFNLHQLDNGSYIRTFVTGTLTKSVPKQVTFGEDSKVIVGGSDHGAVYVFDRITGERLDVLAHAEKGLVQTVTTHDKKGMSMIVTASLGTCGKSTICLWTFKHPDKKRNVPAQTNNVTITTIVEFVIHLAILLAAFAFVYQNVTFGDFNLAITDFLWLGERGDQAVTPRLLDRAKTWCTKLPVKREKVYASDADLLAQNLARIMQMAREIKWNGVAGEEPAKRHRNTGKTIFL